MVNKRTSESDKQKNKKQKIEIEGIIIYKNMINFNS